MLKCSWFVIAIINKLIIFKFLDFLKKYGDYQQVKYTHTARQSYDFFKDSIGVLRPKCLRTITKPEASTFLFLNFYS